MKLSSVVLRKYLDICFGYFVHVQDARSEQASGPVSDEQRRRWAKDQKPEGDAHLWTISLLLLGYNVITVRPCRA